MAEKEEKEEIKPDYDNLKKLFHKKHKNWKELYSDHSRARAIATKAVKEDTTGMDYHDIVDQLTKYMHAYDSTTGKALPWEKMKDYQKEIYRNEAVTMLNKLAEDSHTSLEELLSDLKGKGLNEIFDIITKNGITEDMGKYTNSLIHKYVKTEHATGWGKHLRKHAPDLVQELSDTQLHKNIKNYVTQHMVKYHQRSK